MFARMVEYVRQDGWFEKLQDGHLNMFRGWLNSEELEKNMFPGW